MMDYRANKDFIFAQWKVGTRAIQLKAVFCWASDSTQVAMAATPESRAIRAVKGAALRQWQPASGHPPCRPDARRS